MPSSYGDVLRIGDTYTVGDNTLITPLSVTSAPASSYPQFIGQSLAQMTEAVEQTTNSHAPAPAPAAKEPTTITVEATLPDAEYVALATELGLNTTAIDVERFKGWLNEHGLRVYNRREVQNYLNAKYGLPPNGRTQYIVWGWCPLREADRSEMMSEPWNGRVQPSMPAYRKPIPYPVLLTIKGVLDAFPKAKFFVSDDMGAEQIPDPFLLVRIGREEFVIERWDEPSFRSKS